MNLLFFSTYYSPYLSGITTYPEKLFTHLNKNKKYKSTILTFRHDSSLSKQEKDANNTIVRMPYNFKLSKGFISLSSIKYFHHHIKKTDKLILNIPNFEGIFLALFAKIYRKKIISLFHCHVTVTNHPYAKIIQFFLNLSTYIQLAVSDQIIIYTHDYFDQLRLENRFNNKTIQIFPPVTKLPVDRLFQQKLTNQKKDTLWIGFAGRISQEKGIHVLIKAVQKLHFEKPVSIIFAGPYGDQVVGEGRYYQKIKDQLENSGIDYKFLGALSGGELGSFYKTIDLLTLPSINQTEAFGMVQVEAMQLGTPVVASDLPGVRVPINKTGMGIVAKANNHTSLQKAIQKVLENKQSYTQKKQIQQARDLFSSNKTFTEIEQIINLN